MNDFYRTAPGGGGQGLSAPLHCTETRLRFAEDYSLRRRGLPKPAITLVRGLPGPDGKHAVVDGDRSKLAEILDTLHQAGRTLVGYNSASYDIPILRAILAGEDPYPVSRALVHHDGPGLPPELRDRAALAHDPRRPRRPGRPDADEWPHSLAQDGCRQLGREAPPRTSLRSRRSRSPTPNGSRSSNIIGRTLRRPGPRSTILPQNWRRSRPSRRGMAVTCGRRIRRASPRGSWSPLTAPSMDWIQSGLCPRRASATHPPIQSSVRRIRRLLRGSTG